MRFRVTCKPDKPESRSRLENPFYSDEIMKRDKEGDRVWYTECESEEEVRKLFDEAKAQDLPKVRGFVLF